MLFPHRNRSIVGDYNPYQKPGAKEIWKNDTPFLINNFIDYKSHTPETSIN